MAIGVGRVEDLGFQLLGRHVILRICRRLERVACDGAFFRLTKGFPVLNYMNTYRFLFSVT